MRISGKVVHFDRVKNFGWVAPDSNERDYFLHINALPPTHTYLLKGEAISFEPGSFKGRDRVAVNVAIIKSAVPSTDERIQVLVTPRVTASEPITKGDARSQFDALFQ